MKDLDELDQQLWMFKVYKLSLKVGGSNIYLKQQIINIVPSF